MTRATIDSWKTLPPPAQREPLGFSALFSNSEAEALMQGSIPQAMEDKWFICFQDPWLLFHRSWTGACIYGLRLEASPAGVRIVDSWVNRDPGQYKGTDVDYDRKLVQFLIDAFLLRRPATFPMPRGVGHAAPGVVQHVLAGRGFPESAPDDPSDPK